MPPPPTGTARGFHTAHYEEMMAMCAENGKGIIFLLPPCNRYGDFALTNTYEWNSIAAHECWKADSTPPIGLSDLPADRSLLTYSYHIEGPRRPLASGIPVTQKDFERIEMSPAAVARVWKASCERGCTPLTVWAPREAINLTEPQKEAFRDGTVEDEKAPRFTECAAALIEDLWEIEGNFDPHRPTAWEVLESLRERQNSTGERIVEAQ